MCIVPLFFFIFFAGPLLSAQEERMGNQRWERQEIPTSLSEAHAELERILPPEELAKIDAMPSEDDIIDYHFSLGLDIRNSWGLWRGSPLAEHMRQLGFTDPDIMSSVILQTFWCKRHGRDFRLKERAVEYEEYRDGAWKVQVQREEENRTQNAKMVRWSLMMMVFLSIASLTAGLACLTFARISFHKQGIRSSSGPGVMAKAYVRFSGVAYVLMAVGVLLLLLLLGVLWGINAGGWAGSRCELADLVVRA